MKSENSRPTGTRLQELALRRPTVPRWAFSSLALIVAAALSLGALSVAQATVVGAPDEYTAYVDTVLTVDAASGVLSNDIGDNLTATRDIDATNGTVVLEADGAFTYTPVVGFVGLDTFRYKVSDGGGLGYVWVTLDVVDGPPPADDPPAGDPPIDEEIEPPDVEPWAGVCSGSDFHPWLITLCSAAELAPSHAAGVIQRVIVAHNDRLAGLSPSGLRGHGRR